MFMSNYHATEPVLVVKLVFFVFFYINNHIVFIRLLAATIKNKPINFIKCETSMSDDSFIPPINPEN